MENIKYIHVAGTNGKGSVCAFIAASLTAAGKKTGKFTSPHVVDITERITVNDVPIPHADLERILGSGGVIDCPQETPQFERLMKAAFLYFQENAVEYAVIETGIGGLLDCTNTIMPIVSVITKIGYDHMELLGSTIEEIASHKAGIIKEGVPVVTDPSQFEGAMRVIRKTAKHKSSPLLISNERADDPYGYNEITAKEALRFLGVPCCDFSQVKLLGRMQTVSENPLTVIDGAHNIDSLKAALKAIEKYPHKKIIVFGMLKSKDYVTCLKELMLTKAQLILVSDVSCKDEVGKALAKAQELAGSADSEAMIFICGSLYLAGTVLGLLQA
jgi:dihydrofolate synthase/folylpolyglutamate synthase